MTPKQKAVDLFNDYYSYLKANLMYDEEARLDAKVCALIAVDEIINNSLEYMGCTPEDGKIIYWQEVKQEIEKL
jgi:hypothetical protein